MSLRAGSTTPLPWGSVVLLHIIHHVEKGSLPYAIAMVPYMSWIATMRIPIRLEGAPDTPSSPLEKNYWL